MENTTLLQTIGKRIALLREAQGFTREQFADKIGLTSAGYGKIERGKSDINLTRLQDIAQALNVPISEIMKMSEGSVYIMSCNKDSLIANNNSTITNNNNSVDWVANTFKDMQEVLKSIEKRLNRLENK